MEPNKILNDDRSKTPRAAAYQLVNVYAMKMAAVCMISASRVSMRTRILPSWMAMLGYAPGGADAVEHRFLLFWAPLVFPLWVVLISVNILLSNLKSVTDR